MELTYLTPRIRSVTVDGKVARKMLGEDVARSFHSVIADMRDAMYLGEVPGTQEVELADGAVGINFPLGDSAVLEVEPVGIGAGGVGMVHRVKLVRILRDGKVLA